MKLAALVVVCIGCGNHDRAGGTGSGSAGSAAPVADAAVAKATPPAADAAPVASPPAPPAAPAAPAVTCADGGDFTGAVVHGDEVRYCFEDKQPSCWSVDAAGAVKPIAVASALAAPAPADLVIGKTEPNTPPAFDATKGCGAAPCRPLVLAPDPKAEVDDGEIRALSASGARVAVVRTFTNGRQALDVYDHATGKRLGVAKPKQECVHLEGFADESAVAQEWDCANQGGDRLVVGPSGKLVARLKGPYSHYSAFAHIDGDRWVFSDTRGDLAVYDVVTGKPGPHRDTKLDGFTLGAGRGHVYLFDRAGAVTITDAELKTQITARPPACK